MNERKPSNQIYKKNHESLTSINIIKKVIW